MWSREELSIRDEIIRNIQHDKTQRDSTYHDGADFLLRSRILDFNFTEPLAEKRFDVTIKTVLIAAYPELFVEISGRFQVNPALSPYQTALIHRAFSISPKQAQKTTDNFPMDWTKFDFTAFEELYTQDRNPLWLTLKHLIPIGTKTPDISGLGETIYTPQEKIKTYIQLAEAFKAGAATQVFQKVKDIFSGITSRFGITTTSSQGLIKTPGPDRAVQGVFSMAKEAYRIAEAYPDCLLQVQAAFVPTQNWVLQESDRVLDQVLDLADKARNATSRAKNLGDWIVINAFFYDRGTDYLSEFEQLMSPRAIATSTDNSSKSSTDSLNSLSSSPLYEKLQSIINAYKSAKSDSIKGQKREVAESILSYLEGNSTWYEVRVAMRVNPDWSTPTGIFFGTEALVGIVEELERDPTASAEANFHTQLATYKNPTTIQDIERFESQLRGGKKQARGLNTVLIQSLERKAQGIRPVLEAIADHIEQHHRLTPEAKGLGHQATRK